MAVVVSGLGKGYQLKAKTLTQQGSQPDKDSADPEAHLFRLTLVA